MNCVVIIPAAGSGLRFGGDVPKQFLPLRGQPLIAYAIEKFLREPSVKRVVICVAQDRRTEFERMVVTRGWKTVDVVLGGVSRQDSVFRGLVAASSGSAEFVAVHDAVRPFFTIATFRGVLAAAADCGAALPALPINETIHRVVDNFIVETAERSQWMGAQTPQCFRAKVLQEVLDRARADGFEATDEAGLATHYGYRVRVVTGDPQNLKITRPPDLHAAEANFEEWSKP
jgi:2-C-methyl-D-erythritol 4-phosphate cytidylyltransferase